MHRHISRDRTVSALAVVALHAALLHALLGSATIAARPERSSRLTLFAPLPAPPAPPSRRTISAASASAAPMGRRGETAALPAPPPVLEMPPPPIPIARIIADGTVPAAGAAPEGPRTGMAGEGIGRGAGDSGPGTAGSRPGHRARRIAGAIGPRDYPPTARRRGAQGAATVAFLVDAVGRPRNCIVTGPSGDADLDAATCRLIVARFRYAPARDEWNRPVPEQRAWRQDWWFE